MWRSRGSDICTQSEDNALAYTVHLHDSHGKEEGAVAICCKVDEISLMKHLGWLWSSVILWKGVEYSEIDQDLIHVAAFLKFFYQLLALSQMLTCK